MSQPKLTVTKIPQLNTIVIKQNLSDNFFMTAPNSIIITVSTLAFLLKFLIQNDYISKKVILGILSELED